MDEIVPLGISLGLLLSVFMVVWAMVVMGLGEESPLVVIGNRPVNLVLWYSERLMSHGAVAVHRSRADRKSFEFVWIDCDGNRCNEILTVAELRGAYADENRDRSAADDLHKGN